MNFSQSLTPGALQRRYKRFLADVVLETGEVHVVHVPNPGAMSGLVPVGCRVWLRHAPSRQRKLAYTLELVETSKGLVSVNTLLANRLTAEALTAGELPELGDYVSVTPEAPYGSHSRADLLTFDVDGRATWIEIKSVTLSRAAGLAEWPDCVSMRAAKHAAELARRVRAGDRAAIVFVVQRSDCGRLAIASDLDPRFATALDAAVDAGVRIHGYDCEVQLTGVRIRRAIPVLFRSDPKP